MPKSFRTQQGSTLMLVLVFMFILGTTLAALIAVINGYLDRELERRADFRSYQLALSGLAFGMEPYITPESKLLNQRLNDQERFEVRFESENRRLNINALLLRDDRMPLEHLFLEWGMDRKEANTLIDQLSDWVDADSLKRLNGAEEVDYLAQGRRGQPRNGPFQSMEEIGNVPGIKRLDELQPAWRDYFTVWVNTKLNIMEAAPDVIASVLDISMERADDFSKYRSGSDGIIHTEDDPVFESVEEVLAYLGVSDTPEETLAKLTIQPSHRRIISTGYAGSHIHTLRVIIPISEELQRQNIVWLNL